MIFEKNLLILLFLFHGAFLVGVNAQTDYFYFNITETISTLGQNLNLDLQKAAMSQKALKLLDSGSSGFTLSGMLQLTKDLPLQSELIKLDLSNSEEIKVVAKSKDSNTYNISFSTNANNSYSVKINLWHLIIMECVVDENIECNMLLYEFDPESNLTGIFYPLIAKSNSSIYYQKNTNLSVVNFTNTKVFIESNNMYWGKTKFFVSSLGLSMFDDFIRNSLIFNGPKLLYNNDFQKVNETTRTTTYQQVLTKYTNLTFDLQQTVKITPFQEMTFSYWTIFQRFGCGKIFNFMRINLNNGRNVTFYLRCETINGFSDYKIFLGNTSLFQLDYMKNTYLSFTFLPVTSKDNQLQFYTKIEMAQEPFTSPTLVKQFYIGKLPLDTQFDNLTIGGYEGQIQELSIFLGRFYNIKKNFDNDCSIEFSYNSFVMNNSIYDVDSFYICKLCKQIYFSSGLDFGRNETHYIANFWIVNKCSAICPYDEYTLDYNTKICRPCVTENNPMGVCFKQHSQKVNMYQCGNLFVQPEYSEECDTGNSTLMKGCVDCKIEKNYICRNDDYFGSKCNNCNLLICNIYVNLTNTDKDAFNIISQCKKKCGYILDTSKQMFISINEQNCSKDYFNENVVQKECLKCDFKQITRYPGISNSSHKQHWCENECNFQWKSDRKVCTMNLEYPEDHLSESIAWKLSTEGGKIFFCIVFGIIGVLYIFLSIVDKGCIFWLFWEYLVMNNIILYINYTGSKYYDNFLLFLNLASYKYHTGSIIVAKEILNLKYLDINNGTHNESAYDLVLRSLDIPNMPADIGRTGYFWIDSSHILVFFAFLVVLYPLILPLGPIFRSTRHSNLISKFIYWVYSIFNYSVYLRNIIETYLYMTFYALLQIQAKITYQKFEFTYRVLEYYILMYSSEIAAICYIVCITVGFPIFVLLKMTKIRLTNSPALKMAYNSLHCGYVQDNYFGEYFTLIRLIRALILAISIALLQKLEMIQLMLCVSIQIMLIGVIGTNQILVGKYLNKCFLLMTISITIIYMISSIISVFEYLNLSLTLNYKKNLALVQNGIFQATTLITALLMLLEVLYNWKEIKRVTRISSRRITTENEDEETQITKEIIRTEEQREELLNKKKKINKIELAKH